MTDLIDRSTEGLAWPLVERRRGPRRIDDAPSGDRRRGLVVSGEPHPRPAFEALLKAGRRKDAHVSGYRDAVICIDLVAASIGAMSAYLIRFGPGESPDDDPYLWGGLVLPVLWILAVSATRAYEARFLASAEEYRRVLHAALALSAGIATLSYLLKFEFARGYVAIALPTLTAIALVGRYAARRGLRRARARGLCLQDVLVVGHEWAVLDMVAELRRDSNCGLRVIGACLPNGHGSVLMEQAEVPVLGDLSEVNTIAVHVGADVVAVTTCVEFGGPELRRLCWALENTGIDVVVAPALIEVTGPRLHIRPVAGLSLLHVERPEFTGARRLVKGVFDRTCAGIALVLLSPLLLLLAITVRWTSPGPAFFTQIRIGVRGKPFRLYKFRSMKADAEQSRNRLEHLNSHSEGVLFKIPDDPRVTRLGKVLRRYSLDELPQLINVVKGDMSLVGPRPPLPAEVEQYGDAVLRRLLVKPGLTGLWQVSGRANLSWEDSVRLDLRYVENWSLVWDLEILWKTAYAVIRAKGAY